MCGRYAINLRPSEVRRMLQADNMPVDDAPDDEADDSPRQSYNFAPGYRGVVYRARAGRGGRGGGRGGSRGGGGRRRAAARDESAQASTEAEAVAEAEREENHVQSESPEEQQEEEEEQQQEEEQEHEEGQAQATQHQFDQQQQQDSDGQEDQDQSQTQFILQPMKWGLIPSWTFKSKSKSSSQQKSNYATTLKTINCRDDSLLASSGIWSSIKHRNRCIIPAQGFFEWLNVPGSTGPLGGKKVEKIPHYVHRKDGKLMLFAGLYDCARYTDDETGAEQEIWSYTVITTSSCQELRWLHDRMPVILEPGSEELKRWLDPENSQWGKGLQELLRPFDGAKLEWWPVDKRVGKVGNDGEDLVVRKEEKREERDIGSWFGGMKKGECEKKGEDAEVEVKTDTGKVKIESVDEMVENARQEPSIGRGIKREASSDVDENEQPPTKKSLASGTSSSPPLEKSQRKPPPTPSKGKAKQSISATKNKGSGSPIRPKNAPPPGTQKITKFFRNSA